MLIVCALPLRSLKSMICMSGHTCFRFMAYRSIEKLLGGHRRWRSDLARLLDQASLRDSLSAQLRALLPEDARNHCEVASVHGARLTILAANAAWATRLRFMLPDLLPQLNQLADFGTVRDVQVRVAPHLTSVGQSWEAPISTPQPRPPDGRILEQFAAGMEYGPLKAAILRLARHGRAEDDSKS
jgi:hypothetical protein